MSLPSLPVTLKRGVGRRILGFFMLAGLVPVLFTAGLAYLEVGRGLNQDVAQTLREHAKDYGLDVLARLQLMSDSADQIALVIERDAAEALADNTYLLSGVEAVWFVEESGRPDVLFGPRDQVTTLSDISSARAGASVPSLVTGYRNSVAELVFLRSMSLGTDGVRVLAVKPAAAHLWGGNEDLPLSLIHI